MKYDPDNASHRQELATLLRTTLTGKNFLECPNIPDYQERQFEFGIKKGGNQTGLGIKVYSTIVGNEVRSVGKDAIRVCLVYHARDGVERGLADQTRVNRTGEIPEIVERVLVRGREIYADLGNLPWCRACGAPKFKTSKGTFACANLCWVNKQN